MRELTGKFVISRRTSGLGDGLISLCSAWHYARLTGRTLVIDWRWSRYLREKNKNAFSAFFEPLTELAGVPVISDDSVSTLKYPAPVYSRHQKKRGLLQRACGQIIHSLFETRLPFAFAYEETVADELAIIRSEQDVKEPTIIFRCCLYEIPLPEEARRAVLTSLKPRAEIQAEIDQYVQEHFAGRKIVAVHVRHGNGGNILNHAGHWTDESQAINEICRGIERAQLALNDECRVFLCTDSQQVLENIRARVPDVIARAKYFRPDGKGELHDRKTIYTESGSDAGKEALIEMFLLARADALFCYPRESFFSYYARCCGSGLQIS